MLFKLRARRVRLRFKPFHSVPLRPCQAGQPSGNCASVTVGTSVTSLTYDYENRVTGITYPSSATNSFTYNGNDLRMQKVDSAGTANYVCDGTTPASAVLKDGSAVYTPGLSERRGTTSKFYHGDALGSTRGITNSSQSVTDSVLCDGFGMVVSRTGPTPFGFVASGQYQTDNDSGLMLLGHRYYDASVGRFISSDPAKAGNNWYAYCHNNPLKTTDLEGLQDNKKTPPAGPPFPAPKEYHPKWHIGVKTGEGEEETVWDINEAGGRSSACTRPNSSSGFRGSKSCQRLSTSSEATSSTCNAQGEQLRWDRDYVTSKREERLSITGIS
jgi:RHS repeat-associated protein